MRIQLLTLIVIFVVACFVLALILKNSSNWRYFIAELSAANIRQRKGLLALVAALLSAIGMAYLLMSALNFILLQLFTWSFNAEPSEQTFPVRVPVGDDHYAIGCVSDGPTRQLNVVKLAPGFPVTGVNEENGETVLTLEKEIEVKPGSYVEIESPSAVRYAIVGKEKPEDSKLIKVKLQYPLLYKTGEELTVRPFDHTVGVAFKVTARSSASGIDVDAQILNPRRVASTAEMQPLKGWVERYDLAPSSKLISATWSGFGPAVLSVTYPMSDRTLLTYATSELADLTGIDKSAEALDVMSPTLNRAWGETVGNLQQNFWIVAVRILNGPIQFVTLTVAIICAMILACRFWLCKESWPEGDGTATNAQPGAQSRQLVESTLNNVGGFRARWRKSAPAFNILNGFRSAGYGHQGREIVQALAQAELERINYRTAFFRFTSGALPAIGFIGTVWGIGFALGAVGKVLTPELAQQQSGITDVALKLSVAFDTTLVALLLALLVNLFEALVSNAEEKAVVEAKELCIKASATPTEL